MRYFGISQSAHWQSVEAIHKGWSSDEKYHIRAEDGREYLLRLSDAGLWEQKQKEFQIITKFAGQGFAMSQPVACGLCEKGVYILLTWVEGQELSEVLPALSESEQYRLGRQAGEILRRLHQIPLEKADSPQQTKKARKRSQLERYENGSVKAPNDSACVTYVKENLHKIWSLPPVYQHGDYHPGNLIFTPEGSIALIDFNRWEISDPYEEFYKLESFGLDVSVAYCVGQIDAYFANHVPRQFWEVLAVYVAHSSLFSIHWAIPYGEREVQGMIARYTRSMRNYDYMRRIVPLWYEAYKNGKQPV